MTERKDLEERLKDQLELQEQIFATIPVPLVLKDHHSRFLQVNEAFADFVNKPGGRSWGRDLTRSSGRNWPSWFSGRTGKFSGQARRRWTSSAGYRTGTAASCG